MALSSMDIPSGPVPLNYSLSGKQRIICGLRWDPWEQDDEELAHKKTSPYDLDLACVIYDEAGEAVDGVSGMAQEIIDNSGHVYHTGDDTIGSGPHDDEAISIELKDLPDYIHQIVFLAEIQSDHKFSEIKNPEMRIADGKTDEDQIHITLNEEDKNKANAFIFAKIYRHGGKWMLQYIGSYRDRSSVENWIEELKTYLGSA